MNPHIETFADDVVLKLLETYKLSKDQLAAVYERAARKLPGDFNPHRILDERQQEKISGIFERAFKSIVNLSENGRFPEFQKKAEAAKNAWPDLIGEARKRFSPHEAFGHLYDKRIETYEGKGVFSKAKHTAEVVFAEVTDVKNGSISSRIKDFDEKIKTYFQENPDIKSIAIFGGGVMGLSLTISGLMNTVRSLVTPMSAKLEMVHDKVNDQVNGRSPEHPEIHQATLGDRAKRALPGLIETTAGVGLIASAVALSRQTNGPGGSHGF